MKYFVFTEPSPIKIRFENIDGDKFSISEFSSIVYEGDSQAQADAIISKNKGEPYIYQTSLWLILTATVILAVGVIWTQEKTLDSSFVIIKSMKLCRF